MRLRCFVVALLFLWVCAPLALARKWTERTGKYTVEAEFVDFKDGKVRLKKESGAIVSVPFERLSVADQEWVKQQTEQGADGAKKPSRPAGPPKELAVELNGGVKLEFVLIPAGSFLMGDDKGLTSEQPVHKVTITKPFYLGKYEVTQEQWKAVMGNEPSQFKGPKNPVETVTWEECQAFLAKLNEKFRSSGATYFLPTEAQWEYACRAGTKAAYSFGDDPKSLDDYAWWGNNANNATHPVGEKKPNSWGLYDMHGNVYEYCADWYQRGYFDESPRTDPTGPSAAESFFGNARTRRGGAWDAGRRDGQYIDLFRSGSREFATGARPGIGGAGKNPKTGFRAARTFTAAPSSPLFRLFGQ